MRVIFEEVDEEYFFEIILSGNDLEKLETFGGVISNFVWEAQEIRDMNVFIRKEKEQNICPSLKEKKPVQKKVSPRTSKKKCTKVSHKSKPSQLLSPKPEEEKKKLIRKRKSGKKLLQKKNEVEKISLDEEIALMKKGFEKALGDVRREFETMKTQHKKFTNQVIEWLRDGKERILKHEQFLDGIKHTNENVEEILGNVLLAIRQNEYLQAYYPAQRGFPEMKVVGIHPANLEQKEL